MCLWWKAYFLLLIGNVILCETDTFVPVHLGISSGFVEMGILISYTNCRSCQYQLSTMLHHGVNQHGEGLLCLF